MSETKKANTNRKIFNLSKLKINRISLLNQSNLNVPLKQLYIAKSKLRNMIKEIINNKSEEKQFNVFFNPIRNPTMNINYRENSNKLSPLSEKRKIVRKHNILQNIDFNINLIQAKNNKSIDNNNNDNKSLELNVNNGKFNQSSFSRNKAKTLFNNKNKSSNSNNNFNTSKKMNFDKTINLPILKYSSEESINNLNQNNYKTNSPLNISSPMNNYLNILKKYNKIFTKKSKSKDKNKIEINKYNSYHKNNHNLNLNINHEYNNNNKEEIIKISEHIEESTSNDNNFDIKEIENIITNSSNNVNINKNINYYRNNNKNINKNINKSDNEINIKKDIILNGLKQIKKDNLVNISNNKIISEIINDRIEIPYNINKVSQGTNTDRSRNINSFNQSNIFNENKSYKGMNMSIHKNKELLPYNYKKKNIRNNRTYQLHNPNNTNYFPKFF